MLKFVVVLYRRPDAPVEPFRSILRAEHAAMAERIPGLSGCLVGVGPCYVSDICSDSAEMSP